MQESGAAFDQRRTLAREVGEDLQIRGTVKAALVGAAPEGGPALPESAYSVVIDEPFVRAALRKRLRQAFSTRARGRSAAVPALPGDFAREVHGDGVASGVRHLIVVTMASEEAAAAFFQEAKTVPAGRDSHNQSRRSGSDRTRSDRRIRLLTLRCYPIYRYHFEVVNDPK